MINDLFSASKEKPLFVNNDNMKKIYSNSRFTLYPIHRLAELAAIIREKSTKKLRFVVDSNGHAWFAEEGSPNRTTPAHYQMLASNERHTQCMTAGSIRLSDDYQTIVKIKNKSGDFHPSFDSLKWFLTILLTNGIGNSWLPQQFLIIKLEDNRPTENHELNKMELHTWLNTAFASELDMLRPQPEDCKTIVYNGPLSPPPFRMSFLSTSPASSHVSSPIPIPSGSQRRLAFLGQTLSTSTLPPYNPVRSRRQLALTDEERGEASQDTMELASASTPNSTGTHRSFM